MANKKQFVVIGLGMFGQTVAETLYEMGKDVLVIDENEEKINNIADRVTHAVQADAQDDVVLNRLGVSNFDVGIVAVGNDLEASIMITLALKEAGVKHIISKAMNHIHERALYKIGADRVVLPEEAMGRRVARNISTTNIIDQIELSEEYSIFEIYCPAMWFGKNIDDLDIRKNFGITILGIKRNGKVEILPEPATYFEDGDVIVALGDKAKLQEDLSQE